LKLCFAPYPNPNPHHRCFYILHFQYSEVIRAVGFLFFVIIGGLREDWGPNNSVGFKGSVWLDRIIQLGITKPVYYGESWCNSVNPRRERL